MARIELDNIAHAYGGAIERAEYALHPLDLVWENGGTYALLGPSGCGKSTMLNIVSGLITPAQGRVLVDGVEVTGIRAARRNIAQVFQFPIVYSAMSVYENLAFPLRCRRMASREIDIRVREVAQLLDLTDWLFRPAIQMTADVKQLISLGRGLVRDDVAAILMDEPLTVIDPQLKFTLRRKLKEVSSRHGHTIVYVTHDQNEAMTLADQVIVMDNGRVVQMGTPQQLFERPVHRHVGYFIGSPSMNFLVGRVVKGEVVVQGVPVLKLSAQKAAEISDLLVGIRPEFVELLPLPAKAPALEATITDIEDMGGFAIVSATLADATVIKAKLGENVPQIGERRAVHLNTEWIRCFDAEDRLIDLA